MRNLDLTPAMVDGLPHLSVDPERRIHAHDAMPGNPCNVTELTAFILPPRARASIRLQATSRENHHLWNNHGTWFIHFTVHLTPRTKERIRLSARTADVTVARARRDELFDRLKLGQKGD